MKILITGSRGYVGKYLVSYLDAKGHDVIAHTADLNQEEYLPESDVIINCAAKKRNDCIYCKGKKDPPIDILIYSNVVACGCLARIAKAPIVHLSSVAVYDMNRAYGVTKLLGEHIMRECGAKIIRLPRVVDGRTEEKDIVIGLENIGELVDEAINNSSTL